MMNFLGGIAQNFAINKLSNIKPRQSRAQQLITQGSQNYKYTADVIPATSRVWVTMENQFPEARVYMPFDFMEVINNSAQTITVYLNSENETRDIPSFMIKSFRQPIRQIGLYNNGAVDTVAGDILINFKRMPPDVQVVTNTNTER
jgi:hypothetical protein